MSLEGVPDEVECIRVLVEGQRRVDRSFPAKQTPVLTLRGLPLGTSQFSAFAYSQACEDVVASQPEWLSDPVQVTLVAGVVAEVHLIMHSAGRATVTVDFDDQESEGCADDPTLSCGPGATACHDTDDGYTCECDATHAPTADAQSCRERRWGAPVLLQTYAVRSGSYPKIAMNKAGEAIVVWTQEEIILPPYYDLTNINVRTAHFRPTQGWFALGATPETTGTDTFPLQVAISDVGRALVFWSQQGSVMWNEFTSPSSWLGPASVGIGAPDYLSVAFDVAQRSMLWWSDGAGFWAAFERLTGGWGDPQSMTPEGAARIFQVVPSPGGFLSWSLLWTQQREDGAWELRTGRYTQTGWADIQAVDSGDSAATWAVLNGDGGNLLVVWQTGSTTNSRFYRWDAGWEAVETLGQTSPFSELTFRSLLRTLPSPDAVWMYQASDGLWMRTFRMDAGWQDASLIEGPGSYSDQSHIARMDPQGNILLVWNRHVEPSSNTLLARRYTVAHGWGEITPISTNSSIAMTPALGMDVAGNAIVTWSHFDGTQNNVWARRFE